jgi:hypothetical protein
MRYQIRRAPAPPAAPLRLARVQREARLSVSVANGRAVVVEIGTARVRVEPGVDAATLEMVLAALGARR